MLSSRSDRLVRYLAATAGLLVLTTAAPLAGQDFTNIVSSEFSMSGSAATLDLELAGGRRLQLGIRDGGVFVDGARVGDAARGSALDRQWRDLLTRAMDSNPDELPQILFEWSAEGDAGMRMDSALDAVLLPGAAGLEATAVPAAPAAPNSDSVDRLVERISELQREVNRLEARSERVAVERPGRGRGPFHYITEGISGIFSIVVVYAVLFALGFAVIFFGGRKYIEGVADTVRHATGRSFLVGLAAAFLVVPAFVLGIIALVISVIGIPGLLVWVPGFPVAVLLAALLGYLGVAHAAGEAFAERRFYVTDWFQRGNSYYFLLTGLGLLVALFLASMVIFMAGPWLRPISGMLMFLGAVSTIAFVTIGFGAVLISRGGKQPIRGGSSAEQDMFTEEAGV
ncbi:MAG TPA: hypothetical protein VFZ69_10350 [Longimicrobiales bacterium]